MMPGQVRSIWRGRTVIHIVMDKPLSAKDARALQWELESEVPRAKIAFRKDGLEVSLEVPTQTQETYEQLRLKYRPRMEHNVMITHAVIEGDRTYGEVLIGFLLLYPSPRKVKDIKERLLSLPESLGKHHMLYADSKLVLVMLASNITSKDAFITIVPALYAHSIEVVGTRVLDDPIDFSIAVTYMQQMTRLLES